MLDLNRKRKESTNVLTEISFIQSINLIHLVDLADWVEKSEIYLEICVFCHINTHNNSTTNQSAKWTQPFFSLLLLFYFILFQSTCFYFLEHARKRCGSKLSRTLKDAVFYTYIQEKCWIPWASSITSWKTVHVNFWTLKSHFVCVCVRRSQLRIFLKIDTLSFI